MWRQRGRDVRRHLHAAQYLRGTDAEDGVALLLRLRDLHLCRLFLTQPPVSVLFPPLSAFIYLCARGVLSLVVVVVAAESWFSLNFIASFRRRASTPNDISCGGCPAT